MNATTTLLPQKLYISYLFASTVQQQNLTPHHNTKL